MLSEQKQVFDIIFNDVDKEDYPRVFKLAVPRLRKGGLFVTDNVLWSGRVAEKRRPDAHTKAILEFNRLLYAFARFVHYDFAHPRWGRGGDEEVVAG